MTPAEAVADYLRDAAFTTLNRFVALKMLEARELVQECVTRGEQSAGYREFCGLAPGSRCSPMSAATASTSRACSTSSPPRSRSSSTAATPRLSSGRSGRRSRRCSTILNAPELADVWGEDETIGWVYQYFNSAEERKKMRDESQAPRNSRELAVRNQFFTPRYVVQFLVDNTLGRIWLEMHGEDTRLAERCEYLVRPADEPSAPRPKKDPRDLRILDPACGSGHFLLYSFDLLLAIYEEAWAAEAPTSASEATGRTLREDYPDLDELAPSSAGADRRAQPPRRRHRPALRADRGAGALAAGAAGLEGPRRRRGRAAARSADPHRGRRADARRRGAGRGVRRDGSTRRSCATCSRRWSRRCASPASSGRCSESRTASLPSCAERASSSSSSSRDRTFSRASSPSAKQGELDLSGIDDDSFFQEAEERILEALRAFRRDGAGGASVRGGCSPAMRRRASR